MALFFTAWAKEERSRQKERSKGEEKNLATMSVAIASSPVFSPSRIPLTCKTSPESITIALLQASDGSPSSMPSPSCASSPFRSRFQRLRAFKPSLDLSSSPPPPSDPNPRASSSLLKRKRPARIDIPMAAEAMGFAEAPKSDGRKEVEAEGDRFSVFCKRGRKRLEMEDRYTATIDLRGDPNMAFFGIFDGHGGSRAAEFASENLGDEIAEGVVMRGAEGEREIEEAVRNAYMKTDAEFLKDEAGGGTCCVSALLRNGDLIVSNVGDCRAVLSIDGIAEALTLDHRPSRADEKDRIENLGGYVECCRGVWRLQGSLAVSRGIGDSHLKQWVTAEPETKILKIMPEYEFLILASDGLWDKVSNQEAVDIARASCIDSEKPSPLSACRELAELSAMRGSMDDISVMVIQLKKFIQRSSNS